MIDPDNLEDQYLELSGKIKDEFIGDFDDMMLDISKDIANRLSSLPDTYAIALHSDIMFSFMSWHMAKNLAVFCRHQIPHLLDTFVERTLDSIPCWQDELREILKSKGCDENCH